MHIAVLELTSWSEIAALVGIITAVWGALSAVLVMWLNTKYPNKKAYYRDKEETFAITLALDRRVAGIEQAQAHASAPITALQNTVNDMRNELKAVADVIVKLQKDVSESNHAMDKRVTLIEAGKGRRGGGGR